VEYGVEVEVDGLDHFVLLVLVLSGDAGLVLVLEADLVVLSRHLDEHELQVEVDDGQAAQAGTVGLVVCQMAVFWLLSLFCRPPPHSPRPQRFPLREIIALWHRVGIVAEHALLLVQLSQYCFGLFEGLDHGGSVRQFLLSLVSLLLQSCEGVSEL